MSAAKTVLTLARKQLSTGLFAILLLAFFFLSNLWNPTPLNRYDLIFIYAIAIQVLLLILKMETPREAVVIFMFHLVATVMEIFKTSMAIQSWTYPGESILKIANVPLFAGFMYSAIGSYIVRSWREFDFRFSHYPPLWTTALLGLFIYINFFSHHFIFDIRWILLGIFFGLYYKCILHFTIDGKLYRVHIVFAFLLVAIAIWIAENISTYTHIWHYPHQRNGWELVSPQKIIAWLLLMSISFILVTLIYRPQPPEHIK